MEFQKLLDRIITDGNLKSEITLLLDLKRSGAELDKGPKNLHISTFLEQEIQRLNADIRTTSKTKDPCILDQLFVDILKEVNGKNL